MFCLYYFIFLGIQKSAKFAAENKQVFEETKESISQTSSNLKSEVKENVAPIGNYFKQLKGEINTFKETMKNEFKGGDGSNPN